MILHALNQYYHRKAVAENSDTAPEGFTWKPIPFVILLDAEGRFQGLETRWNDVKKKEAQRFLLPKEVKKTSGIKSNLLWENSAYLLGINLDGLADEKTALRHQAFIQRIKDAFGSTPEDEGVRAVLAFLEQGDFSAVTAHRTWQDVVAAKAGNFTFQLEDDLCVVAERPAVAARIAETVELVDDASETGLCLVTGTRQPIERLHPAIKGVWGAQSSGANIISFNLDAFRSFGHEQGMNAPVGKSAAFAYTEALNMLLAKGSPQRIQVGDASTVFWGAQKTIAEEVIPTALDDRGDPDVGEIAMKALYSEGPWVNGSYLEPDVQIPLYILGLAPNASRIAVRFWHVGTVGEIAGNIRQHFDDLKIIQPAYEKTGRLGLYRVLTSIAAQGKSENIPPNLAGDTMRAILKNLPYPATLLQAAIRRSRAEQDIPFARAAVLKACLNRLLRNDQITGKDIDVALDEQNNNIGYCLGRLFAVLEKIQEEASPGGGNLATIRDRYYGAASSTPVSVFSNLMKLKNHHLSKIEHRGRVNNLEKLLGQIIDHIGVNGYPAHLKLEDQGRFAIGYYHQRQNFFVKSEKSTPEQKEIAA